MSKQFGGRPVLQQAWLSVAAGEAVGLVGRNGAGKTTLLRIAAGLVRADAGSVHRDDGPTRYFGGEATLPPDVPVARWTRFFGLHTVPAEKRLIGQLSRGSRQLFGLCTVLSSPCTALVILDEPWEGLDPTAAAWLSETVRRWRAAGAGLLLSSHRLHDLDAVCSRFVILDDGRCRPIGGGGEPRPRIEQLSGAFTRGMGA